VTRGKYAARAANREAARDNELLVEKMAEIDALTAQLADTQRLLAEERRNRGTLVTARSEEMSAKMINTVLAEQAKVNESYAEEKRFLAQTFTDYFNAQDRVPDFWMGGVLPFLIPDPEERSKYVVDILQIDGDSNREDRRGAAERYERALHQKADMALKGQHGRLRPNRKTSRLNDERPGDEQAPEA